MHDAEMMQSDQLRQLVVLLDQMDERVQNVLRPRFGLDGGKPLPLTRKAPLVVSGVSTLPGAPDLAQLVTRLVVAGL